MGGKKKKDSGGGGDGQFVQIVISKACAQELLIFPAQWDPKLGIHVT